MSLLVPVILFTWPFWVIVLFSFLPLRRAVAYSMVIGWLFLPVAKYEIGGLPDYTKMSATSIGVFLGAMLYGGRVLQSARLSMWDSPMIIWCICPLLSSLTSNLGVYDGVSAVVNQTITWGLPYWLGRATLQRLSDLRELAIVIIIGAIIYVPFCLIEMRLSPQFHRWIYGFHANSFHTTFRYGGFRPSVFMEHGLMVAVWLCSATLLAVWMWRARAWNGSKNMPAVVVVGLLVITTLLVKSTGALALIAVVSAAVYVSIKLNSRLPVFLVLAIAPCWMLSRSMGWDAEILVNAARQLGEDRANSLAIRLMQEDSQIGLARANPLFGLGTWQPGQDQLWLMMFRNHGYVGIISLISVMLAPLAIVTWKIQPRRWMQPSIAPMAGLATIVAYYSLDQLFNAMVNPIFMLMAGGVITCATNGALLLAAERNGRRPSPSSPQPQAVVPRRLHPGGAG